MRAWEFITEAHTTPIQRGSYYIQVDPHALYRAQQRQINPRAIDFVIDRVPGAKEKIKSFTAGEQFYIYSHSQDISLGMRMVDPDRRIIRNKTVFQGRPTGIKLPVVEVR